MPLYRAHIEFDMVVEADDINDAADVAEEFAPESLRNQLRWNQIELHDIKTVRDLPFGWHAAIPWGHDQNSDLTCEKILNPPDSE